MKKVLVAGSTGYLGQYVVKELKKQGYWVRALTRNPKKLAGIQSYIDEGFTGEVTRPASLQGVCEEIDIVFSSIGITRQKSNLTFLDVDYQGNKNILGQAQANDVSKFVYVSVLNSKQIAHLKGVQAKMRFIKDLRQSGLDSVLVCPSGFYIDTLEYLKMAQKGRGYLFGKGCNKINPIHGANLSEVCVNAMTDSKTEIDVGGPEVFTHREIMELVFATLGKPAKITSIPLWLRDILLTFLRTFTSVKTYGMLEFFMTVLAMDMVGPLYGQRLLADFFAENTGKIS